jgi:CBS domain-containing protein
MKTVSDIMKTKKKEVWSVAPTDTVFDALKIMGEKEIGALMVMEEGKVIGIISERDYARKLSCGKGIQGYPCKRDMTANMFSVKPESTVEECMV